MNRPFRRRRVKLLAAVGIAARGAPDRLGRNRKLESVRKVKTDNGVVGKIVVHGRRVREGTRVRCMELERYRFEHVAVEAPVHGQGMRFDLSADKYDPDLVENLSASATHPVPSDRSKGLPAT